MLFGCVGVGVDVIWVRGGGWRCYLGAWGWVEMLFGWVGVGGDVVWVSGVSGDG